MEDNIIFSFMAAINGDDVEVTADLVFMFRKRIDFRIGQKMIAQAKLYYRGWELEFYFYDNPTMDDHDALLDRIHEYFKENPL
jgi:hypothetical protein